jgi:hypothetical protein
LRLSDKKETLLVALIVLPILLGWAWYSSIHTNIIVEKPEQQTVLIESDFQVLGPAGILIVGKSTREQALNIYPGGSNLGRSGVYRPKDQDFLLTFTRKEDILNKMDIGICDLSTAREIKVNDSFSKVTEKYSPNYTRAYEKDKPQILDAMYGSDKQYILFKVEDNLVKKIVIGYSIP